ncbi:MAG: JDVT-CTERM system CAAX-type protease [Nitrospira sp.]|nr:JDVT-CTERM system CAAX-type protease [Nitrospira sp.]
MTNKPLDTAIPVDRWGVPEQSLRSAAGRDLLRLCGLDRWPARIWREPWFAAITLATPVFWAWVWWWDSGSPVVWSREEGLLLLSLILWQPVIEEFGFRGFLQGILLEKASYRILIGPVTIANGLTSLAFSVAHLPTHSFLWVVGIFLVSLSLGYARERSGSLYPAIGLHAYFNAGYYLTAGL